ncbi:hypothetical protein KY290_010037 [Solanum tuberosum]|uniref:Uncharacterized protein n=1 Tax=Solanum tuberosum TaxID=4113 RepID=A0ABQ7VWM5_SOLTU|nr:hypothetical protein KY289_010418 [Solanum tuberosum]KAH0708566.1 hypothetical protein KY284_009993 [Solanum tuberosum]KAH0772900.1 hypothetical protein KY290_010037 [Solanum tuberosum]
MTNITIDATTAPIVAEGSSTTVASLQIDPSHPYFLASSDNPGMGVLISLSAKNKLGFINGTSKCPAEDSPLLVQWKRCND